MALKPTDRQSKKAQFLKVLEEKYSVYHACKTIKIHRGTAYDWRAADEEFAKAWDEALKVAEEKLEASAYERAMKGDKILTIFMLKGMKPDKYKDRIEHERKVSHEELVADANKAEQKNKLRAV